MTMTRILYSATTILVAVCLAAPVLAQGAKVRVNLSAPTGRLNEFDRPSNQKKIYEHDVTIPYGTIGSWINNQIKNLANTHGDREGDQSAGYIDYHYKVNSTADFAFTQTNQPTLTVLSATQNKVRVSLHTEARVNFKADGSATTDDHIPAPPFVEYPDFDGTLKAHAIFKIDATADIAIWPTVAAENVRVVLTGGKPVVKVDDLKGDMTEFSLAVGSAIGFTPAGLMAGGPAVVGLAALLGSNAAYDAAVTEIRDRLAAALEKAVEKANAEIKKQIKKRIEPLVTAANNVRRKALSTNIPGLGISVSDLQSKTGVSLNVRTNQVGSGTATTVTVRFDGQPRNGKVTGTFQFPKAKCQKSKSSIGGAKIALGIFVEANSDLQGGLACSRVVARNGLGIEVFLGARPPGTSLATWKIASGQLRGIGRVRDIGTGQLSDYYECDFQVTRLPMGVLAFTSKGQLGERLKDYKFTKMRRWVLPATLRRAFPGDTSWIVGGAGQCDGFSSGGGLTPNKKEELFEKSCPTCGPGTNKKHGEQVSQPGTAIKHGKNKMKTPAVKGVFKKNVPSAAPKAKKNFKHMAPSRKQGISR